MEHSPLISIALCTYNGEEFIREQMDSLLLQTYKHTEIIVVDDHSTDGTVAILHAYAEMHRNIRLYFNEQNLGYNKNFEKALKLCKGELIAICDQDDIWHKDKLLIQYETIGANLLIYHDSAFIDASGKEIGINMSDKFNFYSGSKPEVFFYMNCVSGHSILFKKKLLDYIFPFHEEFHYDQWIAYKATEMGSIAYIDQCLIQYRQHAANNTDILAVRTNSRDLNSDAKIEKLRQETRWLKICADHSSGRVAELAGKLYKMSLKRNSSFLYLPYGWLIWKHKNELLHLLKKNNVSKFFFTLRKVWGSGAKRIL